MTIGDVAAEAGVSVATVSKVINDRWGVAETTSERVRAVIEELGFQSSLVAQSLRSRSTKVIGVLVVDIEPFSAELLKGVARGIDGSGYELIVFSGCGRAADQVGWERRYLSRVSGTLCDGAILVTPSSVDVTFGAPVVAVDHNVGSSALPDGRRRQLERRRDRDASTCSSSAIAGSGSSRGAPTSSRRDLRERGYRTALERAGIEVDPSLIRVGGYQVDTAKEACAAAARAGRPADRDLRCERRDRDRRRCPCATSLGLAVPDDLSVIGFDNVPESALSEPPLTTIEQPIQQMGFDAVKILIRLIDGNASPYREHTLLPTRLVVRGSCRRLEG